MDWLDAVVAGPESGQQSIDKRNNAGLQRHQSFQSMHQFDFSSSSSSDDGDGEHLASNSFSPSRFLHRHR